MRTIYLDVLLVFDLYMNFLLLRLTARLTHTRLRFGRTLFGAFLGCLESLLVLVPSLPFGVSLICKGGGALLMCTAAFGMRCKRALFRQYIAFLALSCLLAGMFLALTSTGRIYYANGCWYPVISLRTLVIWTIIAYVLLTIIARIRAKFGASDGSFEVHIRYRGQVVKLEGLPDTGNSLVDFCTGKRVIICSQEKLRPLLPDVLPSRGFRPLPYQTVAGEGVLLVFHPEEVLLCDRRRHLRKPVDVLIGVDTQPHEQAIFHPAVML